MAEIPKRKPNRVIVFPHDYTYKQILDENILLNDLDVVNLSRDDLDANMDKLLELISNGRTIKCHDYDSLVFLNNLLTSKVDNEIILVDDGLRINREYIDLTKLNNIDVTVPLTYLMWGVKFNNSVNTYLIHVLCNKTGYIQCDSNNGNTNLSLDNLKKIREVLANLEKYNSKDSAEIVKLVSDYIQSTTQFIDGYESTGSRGIFVTPDFSTSYNGRGLVESINNNHCGVCTGIANYSTMLLNNDVFDLEVESVWGASHFWNKVLIDGKYYFFDNTWSITRSDDYHEDGLITKSFNDKYLLFGSKTAEEIGHHDITNLTVYNGNIYSLYDYPKTNYQSQFEYLKEPIYKSYLKK